MIFFQEISPNIFPFFCVLSKDLYHLHTFNQIFCVFIFISSDLMSKYWFKLYSFIDNNEMSQCDDHCQRDFMVHTRNNYEGHHQRFTEWSEDSSNSQPAAECRRILLKHIQQALAKVSTLYHFFITHIKFSRKFREQLKCAKIEWKVRRK